MYLYSIDIGDWSNDGHNQSDIFIVETSHNIQDIQKAYKRFSKKTGITFDCNEKGKYHVCDEYEESVLDKEVRNILTDLKIDWSWRESEFNEDGGLCCSPIDMVHLFMQAIKSQLEGFEYKIVPQPPSLNLSGKLSMSIGYGCYN